MIHPENPSAAELAREAATEDRASYLNWLIREIDKGTRLGIETAGLALLKHLGNGESLDAAHEVVTLLLNEVKHGTFSAMVPRLRVLARAVESLLELEE